MSRCAELVEWCRKYSLPAAHQHRSGDSDVLVNPQAALTGEETFHLADSVDQAQVIRGLHPQEASSTQLPTLNSLVVKNEVALQQLEADRAARAATTQHPSHNRRYGNCWIWCNHIDCSRRNVYNHWPRECGASPTWHTPETAATNALCCISEARLNSGKPSDEHLHGRGDVASSGLGWCRR